MFSARIRLRSERRSCAHRTFKVVEHEMKQMFCILWRRKQDRLSAYEQVYDIGIFFFQAAGINIHFEEELRKKKNPAKHIGL